MTIMTLEISDNKQVLWNHIYGNFEYILFTKCCLTLTFNTFSYKILHCKGSKATKIFPNGNHRLI